MRIMKKAVLIMICLLFCGFVYARDWAASDWSQLQSRYNIEAVDGDLISISADLIVFSSGLANSANWNEMVIRSNNSIMKTLSGNGNDTYQGFKVSSKTLSFTNLNFANFRINGSSGAAINVNASTLIFTGLNINFTANTAIGTNGNGGAIAAYNSNIYFQSESRVPLRVDFSYNTAAANQNGGAFSIQYSTLSFNSISINFLSNSASAGSGGGIYASSSVVNFSAASATFRNNAASLGAVFYIINSKFNIIDNSQIYLIDNIGIAVVRIAGAQSKFNLDNSLFDIKGNVVNNGNIAGIYVVQSAILSADNSIINFTSNTANAFVGFMVSDASAVFKNSQVNFINNKAATAVISSYGAGAMSVGSAGEASFLNSRVNFTSNTAASTSVANGGAFSYYYSGGHVLFQNSTTIFTHNVSSAGNGGAMALYSHIAGSARTDFKGGTIRFIDNTAGSNGGAIYDNPIALSNSLTFTSMSAADFTHNVAASTAGGGGAIFLQSLSTTVFYNSKVSFTQNSALKGGAVLMERSRLAFHNSTISFNGNYASTYGGAIYAYDEGAMYAYDMNSIAFLNFSSSNASFISNTADKDGGALYLKYNRTAFSDGEFEFSSNTAQGLGGAIYINTSRTIFRNASLSFSYNTAASSGGAIYGVGEMKNADIIDANVFFDFIGNKAYAGGALYFKGYDMELYNADAQNNIAVSSGGAIYIESGDSLRWAKYIIGAINRDSIFEGNKMSNGAIANDIYIENYVELVLNAPENRKIELNSGIIGVGSNSRIRKTGLGQLYLAPSYFRGEAVIDSGILYISPLGDVSGKMLFSNFIIGPYGRFSTVNGVQNDIEVLNSLAIYGSVEVELNYSSNYYDKLYSTDIWISTGAILDLRVTGGGDINTILGSSVPVFIASRKIEGSRFQNDRIIDRRVVYDVIYSSQIIGAEIWVKAAEIVDLMQIAKTENQQTASSFFEGYIDSGNRNRITDGLMYQASIYDYDAVRALLEAATGQIYANILKTGVVSVGLDSLYNKIALSQEDGAPTAIWFELYALGNNAAAPAGSGSSDLKGSAFGFRAGSELFSNKSNAAGIFIRYGANNFTLNSDEADINDIEVGAYGGLFNILDNVDIKGSLSGGLQTYSVKRQIVGLNPKSDFNAYSLRAGLEIDYLIFMPNNLTLTPFIAFNAGLSSNENIEEVGGEEANLLVYNNSYVRAQSLIGAGLSSFKGNFTWSAKLYAAILLTSENKEYEVILSNMSPDKIKVKSFDEDAVLGGLALGGEYHFSDKVFVSADISGAVGGKTNQYYASLSFNYRLGNPVKKQQAEVKELPKEEISDANIYDDIIIEDLYEEPSIPAAPAAAPQNRQQVADDLAQAQQRREKAIISFKLLAAVFDENSANLSAISQRSIREVARQIKELNSFTVVTVEGHTDTIGDNQDNKVLSMQRARAVYEELIRNGIDSAKVKYIGLGAQMPIRSDATLLGRQANRRVEIYVE